ncbi:exonuclease domain-containing protein [Corynebacterium felinum]|nr:MULTISPECIES: exonuclease domain-containing protein [Corynebacterium]MDF5821786.1 exonuclease domain-containing protein [Corynebacterium felinum]MDO4760482.1 exonuclease domain-containing protein [Corynebacterium sp.]
METTGLDAQQHRILSIGWVPINGREIDLSGAGYVLVKGAAVGESATIHHLTDDMVASGVDEAEAVGQLLDALQGRVMLNHFSRLEVTFLDSACRRHFDGPFESTVVDTFAIERRHMERMGTYPRGEDLRLARVRNRYHLPNYRNHNALTDALACAELYLAQVSQTKALTVKSLQY